MGNMEMFKELSSERDGVIWFNRISNRPYGIRDWIHKLVVSERAGIFVYEKLLDISVIRNSATYRHFCKNISRQEGEHYTLTKHIAVNFYEYEEDFKDTSFENCLADLDMNERRSLMRLETVIENSEDSRLVNMAKYLIADEAYHCWFTGKLLKEIGNIEI